MDYLLGGIWLPPWLDHLREAVEVMKGPDANFVKNWISQYLTRHPEVVTKFGPQFDKERIQASDSAKVQDHFKKFEQFESQYKIAD